MQHYIVLHLHKNIYQVKNKRGKKKKKTKIRASMSSEGGKESNFGTIMLSHVVVKEKRNLFWGRAWRGWDVKMVIGVAVIHFLAMFGPFTFSWGAFCVAFGGYLVTGLMGITLCYHRLLAHRSFKLPKRLEYFLAYCGAHAIQRDPIYWVSMHRYHHQYVDSSKDPHSPIYGFWFSHMGWLFDSGFLIEKNQSRKNVEDLRKQRFYRFLRRTYIWHPIGLAVVMYAFGGFPYLVWGMGVRTVWVYHATFLVNSACHIWGNQQWNTGDLSKNNWWVALVAAGEGWHNNHHAFEYSARQGLEWWQVDMTWYAIRFLQAIGMATQVKLPTEAHKAKKSFTHDNKFNGHNDI